LTENSKSVLADQDSLRESIKQELVEQLAALKESIETRQDELSARLDAVEQLSAESKTALEALAATLEDRLDKMAADTADRLEQEREELLAALANLENESAAKIAEMQQENGDVLFRRHFLGNITVQFQSTNKIKGKYFYSHSMQSSQKEIKGFYK
jgi:ABC-type transporter Mla subunit MlaD